MAEGVYVEKIGKLLRLGEPPTIKVQPLRKSMVAFTRLAAQQENLGMVRVPVEDAFVIALQRRTYPSLNVWLDGRHMVKNECRAGTFTLVNLNVEVVQEMTGIFDSIHMHLPRVALNAIAEEQGAPEIEALSLPYKDSTEDPIISSLGQCLLPAFEHPEQANRLFMDHIAMAVLAHMVQAYGGAATLLVRGGLAPWQVRRAKEMLMAHLDGEVTLEQLAGECELSRSHFARAFKRTTGKPPHRWLVEQRIARAKDMLLKTDLALAEIADLCGFSDQSHFTRVFVGILGVAPGEWRHLRRS